MKLILNIYVVLFIQLCNIEEYAGSKYYEQLYDDSQSQENNYNLEIQPTYQDFYQSINQYRNGGYDDEYECNNCACNKCDNPPECCRKVCENCPRQMQMPRIQIVEIPQIPAMSPVSPTLSMSPSLQMSVPQLQQLTVQQMPMSSLPMNMPQMSLPNPPMQMSKLTGSFTFPGPQLNRGLVLFPFPPNFMNIINNMTTMEQQKKSIMTMPQSTTLREDLTTPESVKIITTTQSLPIILSAELNRTDSSPKFNVSKSQKPDESVLESLIRKALADYSNAIHKNPEKSNVDHDKFIMSFKRTKPAWMSKFGVVSVPNNFAAKLLAQLRGIQRTRGIAKKTIVLSPRHPV